MGEVDLQTFQSDNALADSAAGQWLAAALAARSAGNEFFTALSGGRIARKFYGAIVAQADAIGFSDGHVHFFWADERCVPPTDAESNFRLAREALFEPLRIAESQIHRIRGEDDPDAAAREAEAEICRLAPLSAGGQPLLDVVLLGMGEDGHVASLFPGEPSVLAANPATYRAVWNSPKPPPVRITLGFAALAAAKEVWMIVSGREKRETLKKSLSPRSVSPVSRVIQSRSRTKILADFALA